MADAVNPTLGIFDATAALYWKIDDVLSQDKEEKKHIDEEIKQISHKIDQFISYYDTTQRGLNNYIFDHIEIYKLKKQKKALVTVSSDRLKSLLSTLDKLDTLTDQKAPNQKTPLKALILHRRLEIQSALAELKN